MLGFFKYFNFFIDNVRPRSTALGLRASPPVLAIVLPVGISFYTFQALSYTIDVYRGEMRARRNPLDFALFVAFFPHLVAGPIMRAANLLPQVERPRRFSADAARSGLVLMAWGFFKKLVVADNVALIANRVFAHRGADLRDPVGRRLRLRHPDLRGLLRLLGHRARHRALVRLRADRQLQPPVHRAQPARISGGAGTSRCPRGSATTSTSRSAATACRGCSARSTCSRRSSSRASGTARAGTSCCGASITALLVAITRDRRPAAAAARALARPARARCRWPARSC